MIHSNDDTSSHPSHASTSVTSSDEHSMATPPAPLQLTSEVFDNLCNLLRQRGVEFSPHDPNIVETQRPSTLHPYEHLEHYLPSVTERKDFFKLVVPTEDEEYYDLRTYSKTSDQEYTAPPLPPTLHFSEELKRRDREWASVANMAAQITRPIDTTAHALLKTTNPDDPSVANVLRSLDTVRHHLAVLGSAINRIRQNALFREKHVIPPSTPNQEYLLDTSKFLEQAKLTKAVRSADNPRARSRGRGRGRGRGLYSHSPQGQPSFQGGNQSGTAHAFAHASQGNQADFSGQQYFHQALPQRGRGRGCGRGSATTYQ